MSADQVGELTTTLSELTGVDDELIQQGSNLLLTFKNVKNAGAGLDAVFNRANAAALDLAAAGFGSVESNATMLGKALNDPTAGLTALTRAGVQFTEQQKEQIATLVASGDQLAAQKIILGEVEAQVGGTAEASASSFDKIQVALGNLQEGFGAAFLPVIDELLPVFMELLDELGPILAPLGKALAALARVIIELLAPILAQLAPIIAQVATALAGELMRVVEALQPHLPALALALGQILLALVPLLPPLADLLIALVPLIEPLTELAVLIAENVAWIVGNWVPALNALVGPLSTLVGWLSTLVHWLRNALDWMTKLVQKISGGILDKIGGIIGVPWAAIPTVATAGPTTMRGVAPRKATGSVTVNVVSPLTANPYVVGRQVQRALQRSTSIDGGTLTVI